MCDTRKGTSTRKPRLNENVVETQKVVQNFIIQQQLPKTPKRKNSEALLFETPSTSKVLTSPETFKPPLDGSSLIGVSEEFSNVPRRRNVPLPEALIERDHYMQREVVVNNVKVMIKEYRPKQAARARVSALLNNSFT
ncbi:unnamed protein product, partial [Mesorhabditis belari]|uniref:Neurotrophin-3 n=1 Tax=Mesorhabditis belari TaxID=2138241 RepID=A0AAF3ETP9_9BILA